MMSKMEIILEKQMVCHYENGLSSNGLSPHGIENIKKKKLSSFCLNNQSLSVQRNSVFSVSTIILQKHATQVEN